MVKVLAIRAREVLDSRGNPTVEVDLKTKNGVSRASVPSGASTGKHEAFELRDDGKRFFGKGVSNAVKNVDAVISSKIQSTNLTLNEADQIMIDLDKTENKSKLGANAILAVSMAFCKAEALEKQIPLYEHIADLIKNKRLLMPIPSFNVINGGKHAGNELSIQEYMIMPVGAKSFKEALQIGSEVYHKLKELLEKDLGKNAVNVGDEGGFAPPLTCYEDPLDYIMDAVESLGYYKKVKLAIDAAASSFYFNGVYTFEKRKIYVKALMNKYLELIKNYPVVSIEDPFFEEDFYSFAELNQKTGKNVQIVGDDLLTTNPKRIKKALSVNACNCLLLKINQIGTVTEAIEAYNLAVKHNWNVMISHRSGETEDNFISDLAVGLGSGQIKAGAPCRGERIAKYNQLLRIEEELGKKAKYNNKIL